MRGVGEVVDDLAGRLVAPLPELAEEARAVGREAQGEGRVVARVEEGSGPGERARLAEEGEEDVAVGVAREGADVVGVAVLGEAPEVGRRPPEEACGAGALVEEAVVLEEAEEDAGEDPGDAGLRDRVLPPRLVREGRPPRGAGLFVLGREVRARRGVLVGADAEVVLEADEELSEIGEEAGGVDHGTDIVAVIQAPDARDRRVVWRRDRCPAT